MGHPVLACLAQQHKCYPTTETSEAGSYQLERSRGSPTGTEAPSAGTPVARALGTSTTMCRKESVVISFSFVLGIKGRRKESGWVFGLFWGQG